MKYYLKNVCRWAVAIIAFFGLTTFYSGSALADGYTLTMAPMNQNVVIDPGDSYQTSFTISNSVSSTEDTYYKIDVEPFYLNKDNKVEFVAEGESGEIVNWVKFDTSTEGSLKPNETKDVAFTINVPKTAPAGGQYLSVSVTASNAPIKDEDTSGDGNATVKEVKRMSHLVYTEITGNTTKTGEFLESSLPSFLLSGNITASATVKNTGNVHQTAKYTLQVYPLFSDEELYTNEENPTTFTVMPDRELFSEITWDKTPAIGIFNVVFKGEFGGKNLEIKKMVIKCPVWLLFVILFIIFAIVIFFVVRFKKRHSSKAQAQ